MSFFKEVLFCFLIGNSDMHLKNFSLIREHDGEWRLSRAYDLMPVKTVMPTDVDDLALTINGKKHTLTVGDFRKACPSMRLTDIQFTRTLKRITGRVSTHLDEAFDRSFLSDGFKQRCRALIFDRLRECAI